MSITALSPELLGYLLSFLEYYSCIPARFVCRRFRMQLAAHWRFEHGRLSHSSVLEPFCAYSIRYYCDDTAQHGSMTLLQWARAKGAPWTAYCCQAAAKNGHLELLKWAIQNGAPYVGETICSSAAEGGHLGVLQWARSVNLSWDKNVCEKAAQGGHLAVLQWARANGCPWDHETTRAAASHMHVLQWLVAQQECPKSTHVCSSFASRGELENLKWARSIGMPWDESTCSSAAGRGHLALLQWARANGCPWDTNCCECREWARANGAPWDARTCSEAANYGHIHILKWARANGAPWDSLVCILLLRRGNLEALRWAYDNNVPKAGMPFIVALHASQFEVLKWLYSVEETPGWRHWQALCRDADFDEDLALKALVSDPNDKPKQEAYQLRQAITIWLKERQPEQQARHPMDYC